MNILYLTNHLNVGGISSYLLNLTQGLKKEGHSIYIASSGGELEEEFRHGGINLSNIPLKTKCEISPKVFLSFLKLVPVIRQKQIDILHANTRVTSMLASLLSRFTKVPYVVTCHGFFKPKLARNILPLWGKLVIAISGSVQEHLVNDFGVNKNKIRLVYNGIDLDKLSVVESSNKLERKKALGLKDGPVVGIIARLSDVKGHKFLIEAISRVVRSINTIQLFIIGEGKEEQKLHTQVKNLGLESNVVFIRSLKGSLKALSAIDIFAMPSLQEGLGLSIMEAMGFGLPIIASDVGGIRNLIKDDYDGRLVKPQDVEGLSNAIIELLQNKDKAETLAVNARNTISSKFSLQKMILETKEVYSECLSGRF